MTKKYRPYFTLPELNHILESLKNRTEPSVGLISYLERYISDIKAGYRVENLTTSPSLAQRLDLVPRAPSDLDSANPEQLLQIYHRDGNTFKSLSIREIKILQEYRYSNDMMTPEEESIYQESQGVQFK